MNQPLLTAQEVAEQLKVNACTIYRLKDKPDGIRAYKVGNLLRFRPEDVEAYLAARAVKPAAPQTPFCGNIRRFKYVPGMKVVGI